MCSNRMKNKYYDNKYAPIKYIQRYIGLNSSAEMQELNLFPNVKEITESMVMWYAICRIMDWDPSITRTSDVGVYIVGDGFRPRTGALIALMSKFTCYSIDPNLAKRNQQPVLDKIKRISIHGIQVEQFEIPKVHDYHIILMPHSHAPILQSYVRCGGEKTWVVTMPCCVHHELLMEGIVYTDKYVMSPKNEIKIYCDYMSPTR